MDEKTSQKRGLCGFLPTFIPEEIIHGSCAVSCDVTAGGEQIFICNKNVVLTRGAAR
jgi:hypothetical protein